MPRIQHQVRYDNKLEEVHPADESWIDRQSARLVDSFKHGLKKRNNTKVGQSFAERSARRTARTSWGNLA